MDISGVLEHPFWGPLIRIIIALAVLILSVPFVILWERRLLGWMQDRIGPNRAGPFGILQTICDGIKLFFKEDILPRAVDKPIFFLAPAIAFFPTCVAMATVPWGPNPLWTPVANVDIGVLYVLAVSSLGVYGIVLGGWASNNKYSLLGGLRSSAQLISYELAMGFAIGSIVLATGSLEMPKMVAAQAGPLWGVVPWLHNWFLFTPWGIIAAIIFLTCMSAETNRTPFDLPEAESELVAGYHTEYSSMKFALYFMSESGMVLVFSAIFVVLFIGGWQPLPFNLTYVGEQLLGGNFAWLGKTLQFLESPSIAGLWFYAKLWIGYTFYIWIRATLPRLRYDQLMKLGWLGMLPAAMLNLLVAAVWIAFGWPAALISLAVLIVGYLWLQQWLRPKPVLRTVQLLDEAVPLQ